MTDDVEVVEQVAPAVPKAVEDTSSGEDEPAKQQAAADNKPPAELRYSTVTSADSLGSSKAFLFSHMASMPWPFLVVIPALFCLLIGFGWATDDKVETEVAGLWIPQDGDLYHDQQYGKEHGGADLTASSFAALAISRDGGNILTAERLDEVRSRMEAAEATKITYNGNNYTWDDLCAANSAPYQFPCLRLSAMDLFQEARWTFDVFERVGYYRNVIQASLVAPRLPRFGVMSQLCQAECLQVLGYRTTPTSPGYSPLSLFADVGNLEYNHPCRICVEDQYEASIEQLYGSIAPGFGALQGAVQQTLAAIPVVDETAAVREQMALIASNLGTLIGTVTKDDVVEFYSYYVARGLYAQLGAAGYMQAHGQFAELIGQCQQLPGATCPPAAEMDAATAGAHLLAHADNTFSAVTTAGAPFPFWSQADGTGDMFGASEDGTLHPVSGSGIDMSAPITSLADYFGYLQTAGTGVDISSNEWQTMVETNPLYAWFMGSLTPADVGTMCGNGDLTGTNTGIQQVDQGTAAATKAATQQWCTNFDVPNPNRPGPEGFQFDKRHFAKMWYDLLLASDSFLGVVQGESDPYVWTTGAGCDYDLKGQRYSYRGQETADILHNASRLVYNIDEGVSLGAVDRSLLIGGATPPIGEYDYDNPLQEVTTIQSLYASLVAKDIVTRVKNCHRPDGPIDITLEEAEGVLEMWKEAMEDSWNEDWDDDDAGQVQFVSFFDDGGGAIGSAGRNLTEITLDNNTLMAISIIVIALFSALFLFSFDPVESRVLLTLVGVGLVVLSYFAGLGFTLLVDIKMNVSIAWTLPFVIIGLGVDDVYIVLMAIKKQGGYSKAHFIKAMKEVVVPVTMTSLVNASMYAIMNLSDIPAVYLTSRAACYCVICLYLSVIVCFPAYCYLDLKRQQAGRKDIIFGCTKADNPPEEGFKEDFRSTYLYENFYRKLVLSSNKNTRTLVHMVVFLFSAVVFAVGIWGITERDVGLGLEDFFQHDNPAGRWATFRTQELASWSVGINWGALDYHEPDTQMKMIKQFEDVVATPHIAEIDTKQLWMADLAVWSSRHCDGNFARKSFDTRLCGRDQVFVENEGDEPTTCAGVWVENELGLREKIIQEITQSHLGTCLANEGGICRPGEQMHKDDLADMGLDEESAKGKSFCPVMADWSPKKWQFCLKQWRTFTGDSTRLALEQEHGTETACSGVYLNNEDVKWPIEYSDGPGMFSIDLYSHQITLDMLEETRAVCDNHEELHCWMTGIPFEYWDQYDGIFGVLTELSLYAVVTGFGIALIFLFGKLSFEKHHPVGQCFVGSLIGSLLIALSIILTLVTVVGLSILVGVNLTGFSNLSFILSVGFTVEYSVHIVSRWMRANMSHTNSLDRVDYTMSFLMLPTFMSFVSSTIGVICLAFTEFAFTEVFFFRPLMIVMFISYWFGCWFLPTIMIYLDFDVVKLGKPATASGPKSAPLTKSKALEPKEVLPVDEEEVKEAPANPKTYGEQVSM